MRSRRTRNPRKARRARDAPCKSTIPRLYNPPSISLLCTCSCDADMSTWYFFCRSSLGTLAHASSGSGCVGDDTLRPVPLVCGRRALGRHCGGAPPPNARTPNARRLDPSAFYSFPRLVLRLAGALSPQHFGSVNALTTADTACAERTSLLACPDQRTTHRTQSTRTCCRHFTETACLAILAAS